MLFFLQVKTFPSMLEALGVGETFLVASGITLVTTLWGVSTRYSQFHKTLPISSFQMHWISVRFYNMGDILTFLVDGRGL